MHGQRDRNRGEMPGGLQTTGEHIVPYDYRRPFVERTGLREYVATDGIVSSQYGSVVLATDLSNKEYKIRYERLHKDQRMKSPPSSLRIFPGYLVVRNVHASRVRVLVELLTMPFHDVLRDPLQPRVGLDGDSQSLRAHHAPQPVEGFLLPRHDPSVPIPTPLRRRVQPGEPARLTLLRERPRPRRPAHTGEHDAAGGEHHAFRIDAPCVTSAVVGVLCEATTRLSMTTTPGPCPCHRHPRQFSWPCRRDWPAGGTRGNTLGG